MGAPSGRPALIEEAPAKVNLTLAIRGRRTDGYHELESLVAFARFGDRVSLLPGEPLDLSVSGPFAEAVGATSDNLVLKGARALAHRVPGLELGSFALVKHLPVAAGIGGGSADAAAALRLLARANALDLADLRLADAAQAPTGSTAAAAGQGPRKIVNIDFPSAASIPAVSIMNPEPTGPVLPGAAAAAASNPNPQRHGRKPPPSSPNPNATITGQSSQSGVEPIWPEPMPAEPNCSLLWFART